MAADPSVLAVLQSAVETDPRNSALRLHLAEYLLASGDPANALVHLEAALAAQPDHIEALRLAAAAAERAGDAVRSEGWARLHRALSGSDLDAETNAARGSPSTEPEPAPNPNDTPPRVVADASEGSEADWDTSLQDLLNDVGYWERVTLANVGGLHDVKERIETSFLGPMRNPELRQAYGSTLRGGLLLWGPPGCGKTFLARAIAGELGAHFLSVGLNDVLDMWLGNSEKQLHELFKRARRTTPFVLFFDELDAVGHKRQDLGRSGARNVVAQLLTELDGTDSSNDGVFVLGATNQPWDVEPALRRPGRFDRTLLVLPPDPEAREMILRYNLRDRPFESGPLDQVVKVTEGFSGADLRLACDDATHKAMADAVRTGAVRPITPADLLESARALRPTTRSWFDTAGSFARYSNSSGEYDDLVDYMRRQRIG